MVKAALHVGRAAGERWGRVRDRDCPWHTRSRYTYISPPCCRVTDLQEKERERKWEGEWERETLSVRLLHDRTADEHRSRSANESALHDCADKSPYPDIIIVLERALGNDKNYYGMYTCMYVWIYPRVKTRVIFDN